MKRRQPTPKMIRVCERCGEAFETTEEHRTTCPGGCHWRYGSTDPVAHDDTDAFRKSSHDQS